MHNPEIWGDPEVFRPERFSEEESKNRPSMVHVPFGAGPRTCIGSKFSILEQCVFLIELLRRYTVVLVDPNYEMKYKKNTILLAVEDFKITLVPRK
jgi:cytochrome P450